MPIIKHEFPILEHDLERNALINPRRGDLGELPETCVMTFFGDVRNSFVARHDARIANSYVSEMRSFPIYELEYKGARICVVQATVGSASVAMITDFIIGYGVKTIIACGSCGVLDNIPAGDVILPTSALRDEGASYHYLPPSRDIELDTRMLAHMRDVLDSFGVPHIDCKTWTTDGFFRETPDMIAYRKQEGCKVVEMECATIAAVAKFRGARFAQLLYSGDILFDPENYDERDWPSDLTSREKIFSLALEAAIRLEKP